MVSLVTSAAVFSFLNLSVFLNLENGNSIQPFISLRGLETVQVEYLGLIPWFLMSRWAGPGGGVGLLSQGACLCMGQDGTGHVTRNI